MNYLEYPKPYQADLNLHSLLNFKDFIFTLIVKMKAESVVEIGIEHGKLSKELKTLLEKEKITHIAIDPNPTAPPEKYTNFFNTKSLDYLEKAEGHDLYLIDGDHNYYTVSKELEHIKLANGEGQRVILLHDVSWPCSRRDFYYNINDIPDKNRLPSSENIRISPGNMEFDTYGFESCGHFHIALKEGGEKNGVLSAVEDFLKNNTEYTYFSIPCFYGLGILFKEDNITKTGLEYLKWLKDSIAPFYQMLSALEYNRVQLYTALIKHQQIRS